MLYAQLHMDIHTYLDTHCSLFRGPITSPHLIFTQQESNRGCHLWASTASGKSLKCDTDDDEVMACVSDCVSSAEAHPSVGEEVDEHRWPPPTRQGGPVPLLHQAVGRSGLSPESSQRRPGDGGQQQSQHPQIPEE